MKKASVYIIILVLLIVSCVAVAETYSLDQAVPFGIVDTATGNTAAVYNKASTKNKIDTVYNGKICQIQSTDRIGGTTWYKVRYFDDKGNEFNGYIAGGNFDQMSVAELIAVMSDSKIAKYMQNFVGFTIAQVPTENPSTSNGFNLGDIVAAFTSTTPAPTSTKKPTASKKPTPTPQLEHTYILNKNTKVFHYSYCSSVKRMSEKNKIVYTGTRQSVINKGYKPCSICKP